PVGTVTAPDQTFSPGQSASYTPTFSNAALDPGSQPLSQQIVVVVNAQVSAGLYNSQASASYSELVHFPSQACSTEQRSESIPPILYTIPAIFHALWTPGSPRRAPTVRCPPRS